MRPAASRSISARSGGSAGDIWAGWRRVKPHIGAKGEVTGWFRRGMGGYIIMSELKTSAGRLKAYPYVAGVIVPLVIYTVLALIGIATYDG